MAIFGTLTSADIYFGPYDLSGVTNQIDTNITVADKDATTFGSNNAQVRTGGLIDFAATVDGFGEFGVGLEDDTLWASFATNTHNLTVSPTGADGDIAYFVPVLQTNYKLGGKIGDILPFHQEVKNRLQYAPVAGKILLPKQVLPSGATNGTVTVLPATSATQSLYAVLHVFAVSGTSPTVDVLVKSAALVGFASPTTRITFAQQVAAGESYAVPIPGAITDGFYRITATVGGSATPTVTAAVAVAVQ